MKLNSSLLLGFILISSIFLTFSYHYDVFAPTISVSPTSAIIDGVGGVIGLNGAQSVTTAEIGGSTYALVASNKDDGIQIMDITVPGSPTPTSAPFGGVNGFSSIIKNAQSITTAEIGGSTYALVASNKDDGIQIIDITTPSSPTPTSAVFDEVG